LIVIDAPHFYAAVLVGPHDRVYGTAPILKYMFGWEGDRVLSYARRKRWSAWRQ